MLPAHHRIPLLQRRMHRPAPGWAYFRHEGGSRLHRWVRFSYLLSAGTSFVHRRVHRRLRQCGALRVEIGPSTFGATFSSFAACVSKLTPLERQNTAAAGTLCRVRFPDGGSPPRLFESCVMTFAKSASLAEQQSLNPARTCASLRSSIGTAAFASKYGTGGDTANAFGKCVSTTTGAQLAVETIFRIDLSCQQDSRRLRVGTRRQDVRAASTARAPPTRMPSAAASR